jgi:hypothetical protein
VQEVSLLVDLFDQGGAIFLPLAFPRITSKPSRMPLICILGWASI